MVGVFGMARLKAVCRLATQVAMFLRRPRVHTLRDNRDLTEEQYRRLCAVVERVQHLYDEAPDYVARRGLDPAVAFSANEWGRLFPKDGVKFRSSYADLNYIRLAYSYSGYHLLLLDRFDVRKYPDDGNEDLLRMVQSQGVPPDIADILPRRIDMAERLACMADQQKKFVRNVPAHYVVAVPNMMGEIGLKVRGIMVNPDTLMSQSRVNAMLSSGIIDKLWRDIRERGRARILEVGAGHGALVHALKMIFGDALEVVIIDLPSSIYHSAVYLNAVTDGVGWHLASPSAEAPDHFGFLIVANHLVDELADRLGPIDMAINTMSFQEMSPEQVRAYAHLFDRLLRPDGVVFDENENSDPLGYHIDSCQILAEVFPHWKRVESGDLEIERKCRVWSKSAHSPG
jgi:hypothetical protein